MAKKITREELIILAGLSVTVNSEGWRGGAQYRLHPIDEMDFVKRSGVRITRRKDGSLYVIVGGHGKPTT